MINVALLCTNGTASLRPTMSLVVSMLEGRSVVQEFISESSEALDEKKLEATRHHYQEIEENNLNETSNQSFSVDDTLATSSMSATDLYPINMNSSYWDKRGWWETLKTDIALNFYELLCHELVCTPFLLPIDPFVTTLSCLVVLFKCVTGCTLSFIRL